MPTYEYACDACGHRFEQWQTMSEAPVRVCPKCRKRKVRRLISGGAGVIFKGSGFYETDYKRNRGGGKPSEAKSEASSDAKTDPKPDSPSDSKPDSKSDSTSDSKSGSKSAKSPKGKPSK